MNIRRRILTTSIAIAVCLCVASLALANGTLVRWHKMGEDDGGSNGAIAGGAVDTPIDGGDTTALDLSAANGPVFRTITGRPDGGGGLGIEFAAASQQYMNGLALNWPQESALSDTQGGHLNLAGIDDRSLQFWVRPTSAATQTIVMDTNQHGVRIANGKFSMRYGNVDYESTQTVTPGTWYHVQVARPDGPSSASRMYVNGIAVAVSPPIDYSADNTTFMTVGSNSASDGEFFSGIVDDLRMHVFGSSNAPIVNYGAFNFATDNAFAASPVTGIKGVAGDVTNDGFLTQADKDAFIAGWLKKRLVNGIQIGDMASRAQGDLNLDGITNINDLLLLQNALPGAGLGTITAAELAGVPEPATAALLLLSAMALPRRSRRADL